jgi:putative transposase
MQGRWWTPGKWYWCADENRPNIQAECMPPMKSDGQGHGLPERRSPRLRGYDYTEAGEYFVTVCTNGRTCILGEVVDGKMELSPVGEVVRGCWREIPGHFPLVRTHAFQVMPNHVHGIIEICRQTTHLKNPCRDVACNVPTRDGGGRFAQISPRPSSLSVVVRSFKSASTKHCHDTRICNHRTLWQPRFHDRIIRDDREHFFIEQYITLNPMLWHLDQNNPAANQLSGPDLRRELQQKLRLDESSIEYMLAQ